MSEWQGFLKESKKYMGYDDKNWYEKLKFWAYFPIAWSRYTYYKLTEK